MGNMSSFSSSFSPPPPLSPSIRPCERVSIFVKAVSGIFFFSLSQWKGVQLHFFFFFFYVLDSLLFFSSTYILAITKNSRQMACSKCFGCSCHSASNEWSLPSNRCYAGVGWEIFRACTVCRERVQQSSSIASKAFYSRLSIQGLHTLYSRPEIGALIGRVPLWQGSIYTRKGQ